MKKSIDANVFKGIAEELKKVEWPSKQEALHLTVVVVIISILIAAYIGVLDFFFAKALTISLNLRK